MTRPRAIGLSPAWHRMTAALLVGIAVLALVTNWPGDPRHERIAEWVGTVLVALVGMAALITYRRLSLAALPVAWLRGRRAGAHPGGKPARTVDHRHRYGRGVVGIREAEGHLVSVISVAAMRPPVGLPIARIAAGLREFDVCLEQIDIVSVIEQGEADGPVWVVLRLDPLRNLAGVVVRDSVAAMFAAATERLAEDLGGAGRSTRILDSAALEELDGALLAGLGPEHLRVRLGRVECSPPGGPAIRAGSWWVVPGAITSALPDAVRRADADVSVLTVTLVPGQSGARISALVRQHYNERPPGRYKVGCQPLTGRQLAAIAASLPIPRKRPAVQIPARDLAIGEQWDLPLGAHRVVAAEVGG